jgi:hypothetical protein
MHGIQALSKMKTHQTKNPSAVALGRLGGRAGTGKAKARTTEQARAAAKARWAKKQAKKQ